MGDDLAAANVIVRISSPRIQNSSKTRLRPVLGQLLTSHGTDAEWVLRSGS